MKITYLGNSFFRMKVNGQMIHVKNGTEVDVSEKDSKDLSKRKVNGEKQWGEPYKAAPKKGKKGAE